MDLDECMEIFGLNINPRDLEEAIKAFKYFDKSKIGVIPISKLQRVYQTLQLDLTEKEIQDMLVENDLQSKQVIDLYEFLSMTACKVDQLNSEDNLLEAFKMYDIDGNGEISATELRFVLTNCFGVKISKQQAEDLINAADEDGNGSVNYEEFVKITRWPMFKEIFNGGHSAT